MDMFCSFLKSCDLYDFQIIFRLIGKEFVIRFYVISKRFIAFTTIVV